MHCLLPFREEVTVDIPYFALNSPLLRYVSFQPAFHGREATCICYIDSLVGQQGRLLQRRFFFEAVKVELPGHLSEVIGLKIARPFFDQSEAKPKPIAPCVSAIILL